MLNHVRSRLFVDRLSRPVMVLDRLPGLYGLKYDSATACGPPLYLCSYKLVGSATRNPGYSSLVIYMLTRALCRIDYTLHRLIVLLVLSKELI